MSCGSNAGSSCALGSGLVLTLNRVICQVVFVSHFVGWLRPRVLGFCTYSGWQPRHPFCGTAVAVRSARCPADFLSSSLKIRDSVVLLSAEDCYSSYAAASSRPWCCLCTEWTACSSSHHCSACFDQLCLIPSWLSRFNLELGCFSCQGRWHKGTPLSLAWTAVKSVRCCCWHFGFPCCGCSCCWSIDCSSRCTGRYSRCSCRCLSVSILLSARLSFLLASVRSLWRSPAGTEGRRLRTISEALFRTFPYRAFVWRRSLPDGLLQGTLGSWG